MIKIDWARLTVPGAGDGAPDRTTDVGTAPVGRRGALDDVHVVPVKATPHLTLGVVHLCSAIMFFTFHMLHTVCIRFVAITLCEEGYHLDVVHRLYIITNY